MLPLIQHQTVNLHHWITQSDFVDIIAIAQITPGPIAINSATFVGYQVAGVLGSIVATIAVVSGPVLLILLVARLTEKFASSYLVKGVFEGLRPGLLALIAYSAVTVARTSLTSLPTIALCVGAFALLLFTKLHPLIVLAAAALVGGLFLR